MRYEIIIVGGEKDGQTIYTTDSYKDAYKNRNRIEAEMVMELHPVWGGVMIVDTETDEIM